MSEGDAKLQKDARDEAQRVARTTNFPRSRRNREMARSFHPAAALDGLEGNHESG